MRVIRAHLAAWLMRLTLWVTPDHPYKRAMISTMAEHGRTWWRHWRAETGR